MNLCSSIIYQFPLIDTKQFKCYEFPKIEEAVYQEKSISHYEIPQYIQDIPEGFSIFCTLWEASKVKQYMQLSQEEQDKLGIGDNEEKDTEDILLKEPIPKTNYCNLCRRNFDDYLQHIDSIIHKNSINKNQMMINTAKDTFKRINQFWNNKNNNNNDLNSLKNYSINEKNENNKLAITSYSSFSSSISTFKYEDSNFKSINSFHEQDTFIFENINNKENQSDNIMPKKSKNKNIFITPFGKEKLIDNKSSNLSSSQSSFNMFINKKRKSFHSLLFEEKNEKTNDYFPKLNNKNTKKLIRGIDIYFK